MVEDLSASHRAGGGAGTESAGSLMPVFSSPWFGAALGLVVGSFLNVCIHRLPLRASIVWPASRCPHCSAALKAYDNIPVLSYLLLGGRCRSCGKPISVQYPIVELVTGLLFFGTFLLFEPPLLYQRLLFACAMIVLFVIDLQHRILPDAITLPGIVVGFASSFFMPPGWFDSLVGIIVGGGSLWLMGEVYFRLRHEEGMGFGDVKMLAMIGAFLGWKLMLLTLVLSSFVGSIVGVAMIALNRGDMKYALPFGTFLAIGAMVAGTFGERIIAWYATFFA
jgi:leader peptidase (prepilin peptidase)/N-methyltransferase